MKKYKTSWEANIHQLFAERICQKCRRHRRSNTYIEAAALLLLVELLLLEEKRRFRLKFWEVDPDRCFWKSVFADSQM